MRVKRYKSDTSGGIALHAISLSLPVGIVATLTAVGTQWGLPEIFCTQRWE